MFTRLLLVFVLGATASACGGDSGSPPPGPITPSPNAPRLTAPVPDSPGDDEQLSTLRPTLTVRNGTSDQSGSRTYEFQVSDNSDFSIGPTSFMTPFVVVASRTGVPEGSGTTSFTPDADLQPTTRLYWRARMTQGSTVSEWSAASRIRTKLVGFIRAGELYDPLIHSETVGVLTGSTSWIPGKGVRINDENSYVRYALPQTIVNGEFSMDVEGLFPNNPGPKAKVFSMMDGGNNLYGNRFLLNAQYRGADGNPDNAIAFKAVFGDENRYKLEPDRPKRIASIRSLDPARTYHWKGTWGSEFRLVVRDGGIGGATIYDYGISTAGVYNPNPHVAYLGANNGRFGQESGAWAGAIYRNVWIGNRPRPASLGSALDR